MNVHISKEIMKIIKKHKCLRCILINYYRLRMTNDRPDLSSARALNSDSQTTNFEQKVISGHKFQSGLDTPTYGPTDRQSQRDFDFDFEIPT
jgi:hypothetical protein